MAQPLAAGLVVLLMSLLAVVGPLLGLPPGAIALLVGVGLALLTVDSARFGGRGGHLLAEALPGGEARLRRIAIHEAGHVLWAAEESLPVGEVRVGSLACWRAGLAGSGSTELAPPDQAKLPLPELRRWSRVLLAGMLAEQLVYGDCIGGADDRALLGRIWGLSGHDVDTAQREQRQARREVERGLGQLRQALECEAERLLGLAPRLLRPAPPAPPLPVTPAEPGP